MLSSLEDLDGHSKTYTLGDGIVDVSEHHVPVLAKLFALQYRSLFRQQDIVSGIDAIAKNKAEVLTAMTKLAVRRAAEAEKSSVQDSSVTAQQVAYNIRVFLVSVRKRFDNGWSKVAKNYPHDLRDH